MNKTKVFVKLQKLFSFKALLSYLNFLTTAITLIKSLKLKKLEEKNNK